MDLDDGIWVGRDDALTTPITIQRQQLGEESTIEQWRISAMVAPTRNDDPPRQERADEFPDGLRREIRLVPDADQGGVGRVRQRTQADGDRATDAVVGMGILDRRQRKAAEGLNQAGVGRDDGDERSKTRVQEAASGPADQRLTMPRFEQLLASEPRRLPGREQNAGDQTACVAALSS